MLLAACRRREARGFTLLELMVVVVIISIMIAAATITLQRNPRDLLVDNGDRFRALVSLARDEAVFGSRTMGIGFSGNGYAFFQMDDAAKWLRPESRQYRQRLLPQRVTLEVFREGVSIALPEEEIKKPDIVILSSGEMTPFDIEFSYPGENPVALRFDVLGEATVLSDDET
jgi:general secretion pathway protein H